MGNLSESDIRGLGADTFMAQLSEPVGQFLSEFSMRSLTPVFVTPHDTIMTLFETVVGNRLHHVWVQDADGKPTGVITLTDIMNALLEVHVLMSARHATTASDASDAPRQRRRDRSGQQTIVEQIHSRGRSQSRSGTQQHDTLLTNVILRPNGDPQATWH